MFNIVDMKKLHILLAQYAETAYLCTVKQLIQTISHNKSKNKARKDKEITQIKQQQ